jgi:alpha-methylacyl-CoA racemase
VEQHAPAPRFSRTPAGPVEAPHKAGADTAAVLQEAGFSAAEIEALRSVGALS